MKRLSLFLFACAYLPVIHGNDLAPAFEAVEARQFKQAIKTLERLADESRDRDTLFHLALNQYRQAEFKDADETLSDLHDQYPADADALYLSGLVYLALVGEVNMFRKVGMAKKTIASWEAAVAAEPDHLNSRFAIFAFYTQAPAIAGGDIEKAATLQTEMAAMNEEYGTLALAMLSSRAGNLEAAEAAFQHAFTLTERAGPHFSFAQYLLRTEQWEEAIKHSNEFLDRERKWWDPDITMAYLIKSRAHSELGNNRQAREMASQGLALNPNRIIRKMLEEALDDI
ncbi:MAG: tetratricopeptide repeat protein [Pseudomonadales bacterium]